MSYFTSVSSTVMTGEYYLAKKFSNRAEVNSKRPEMNFLEGRAEKCQFTLHYPFKSTIFRGWIWCISPSRKVHQSNEILKMDALFFQNKKHLLVPKAAAVFAMLFKLQNQYTLWH